MKRFNSRKWITENKYGKLSEMKYDDPFDQEEEDPKNPMGLGEKKDYTSTEDFGTLFPDAMQGGLGKARANMPQVPADDFETDLESPAGDGLETNEPEKIPDLRKATTAYLNSSDDTGPWPKGDQVDVSVEKGIDPMDLKPTQADIYMSNALKKVKSAEEGTWKPWASSVLASNDGHILDGHHRWAATIVYNDKNGTNEKMSINKVNMPIKDLLKVANAYTDAHPKGVRQGGAGTATEGMSPEEWADAKEKERLNQHPEKDKINKIKQMMDKEKDEEQEEYDKGWYGESLKKAASKLGYLNEIDLNAISAKKASFVYTEQGGRFYSLTLSTSDGQTLKMKYDEANEWLKDTLSYIHEGDLIPRRYNSGLEDLDLIVARLEELGIEASHGDYMDVS